MKSKSVLGTILIVLGILFIIDNTSSFGLSGIIHLWWPLLIVLFGLHLFTKKNPSYMTSFFITAIGILLLAQKLDLLRGDFGDIFWPLVIVAVGISFLFPRWGFHSRKHKNSEGTDINSVFGSINRKIDDKNFKGANISVIFGSAEIDFSNAEIDKEAVLNVDSAFASLVIFVPTNWNIEIKGSPIFGSISDKRRHKEITENSPRLKINNSIVFGGMEIKD